MTGHPDEPPLYNGFSLADASSGLYGSFMINMLLLDEDRKNISIDLALYEPLLEMLAFQFHSPNAPAMRQGTNNPYGWGLPENTITYPTLQSRDNHWFQIKLDTQNCSALKKQFISTHEKNFENDLIDWSRSKTMHEIFSQFL